jgi:hypothetical protein
VGHWQCDNEYGKRYVLEVQRGIDEDALFYLYVFLNRPKAADMLFVEET